MGQTVRVKNFCLVDLGSPLQGHCEASASGDALSVARGTGIWGDREVSDVSGSRSSFIPEKELMGLEIQPSCSTRVGGWTAMRVHRPPCVLFPR